MGRAPGTGSAEPGEGVRLGHLPNELWQHGRAFPWDLGDRICGRGRQAHPEDEHYQYEDLRGPPPSTLHERGIEEGARGGVGLHRIRPVFITSRPNVWAGGTAGLTEVYSEAYPGINFSPVSLPRY